MTVSTNLGSVISGVATSNWPVRSSLCSAAWAAISGRPKARRMLISPWRQYLSCSYVRNITRLEKPFRTPLSTPKRGYALDGKPNNDSTLAHHSFVELGPAFVLAINLAMQVDQRIHSVGK